MSGGAQRPVLRVYEPKKAGALSARAHTRGQNPIVKYNKYILLRRSRSLETVYIGNIVLFSKAFVASINSKCWRRRNLKTYLCCQIYHEGLEVLVEEFWCEIVKNLVTILLVFNALFEYLLNLRFQFNCILIPMKNKNIFPSMNTHWGQACVYLSQFIWWAGVALALLYVWVCPVID